MPSALLDQRARAVLQGAKRLVAGNAKLGRDEEMQAMKRLDDQARRLERSAHGPPLQAFIADEREVSPELGGRSVFGWEAALPPAKAK